MGGWQVHVWVEGEEARAAAAILPGIECVVCTAWPDAAPPDLDSPPSAEGALRLLDARFDGLPRHSDLLDREAASLTGVLSAVDLVRQVVAGGLIEAADATTTTWSGGDVSIGLLQPDLESGEQLALRLHRRRVGRRVLSESVLADLLLMRLHDPASASWFDELCAALEEVARERSDAEEAIVVAGLLRRLLVLWREPVGPFEDHEDLVPTETELRKDYGRAFATLREQRDALLSPLMVDAARALLRAVPGEVTWATLERHGVTYEQRLAGLASAR